MPWLVGTALLHSSIVVEKRDSLKSWTILLSILTFSLSLIGTFLVRSGVLTSVRAFATDPDRGVHSWHIDYFYWWRSRSLCMESPLPQRRWAFPAHQPRRWSVLNNLLLTTSAATIFLGTIYPLVLNLINGSKISVGPPYFNATFVPLMAPLVAALAIGPMLEWKSDIAGILSRLKVTAITAFSHVGSIHCWRK